jgi:hypothetical protein
MTLTNKVKALIKARSLNTKSRRQIKVYTRFVLYNLLREEGYSFPEIGRMFNRDHSSILHGLKAYKDLQKYEDFQKLETDIIESLSLNQLEYDISLDDDSLADKILSCRSYLQFLNLKEKVLKAKI